MEPGIWILFICITISVIALIAVSKKDKSEERTESVTKTVVPVRSSEAVVRGIKSDDRTAGTSGTYNAAEIASTPTQNTLYAYGPVKKTRCCPVCDGENIGTARFCCICGKPMG